MWRSLEIWVLVPKQIHYLFSHVYKSLSQITDLALATKVKIQIQASVQHKFKYSSISVQHTYLHCLKKKLIWRHHFKVAFQTQKKVSCCSTFRNKWPKSVLIKKNSVSFQRHSSASRVTVTRSQSYTSNFQEAVQVEAQGGDLLATKVWQTVSCLFQYT